MGEIIEDITAANSSLIIGFSARTGWITCAWSQLTLAPIVIEVPRNCFAMVEEDYHFG